MFDSKAGHDFIDLLAKNMGLCGKMVI